MKVLLSALLASLLVCYVVSQDMGCPGPGGCPVSQCGHFQPGQTPYSCHQGFVKDSCGCELQTCQCANCRPFDNTVFCQYGYRTMRGCPTSRCNSRPPSPAARCPNSMDPTGALGPNCISKAECHPGDLCCKSYRTNSMNCMRGMRLNKIPAFPPRCGLPPAGPQNVGEECSRKRQCPVGYICCPTNFGSQLGSICREDNQVV